LKKIVGKKYWLLPPPKLCLCLSASHVTYHTPTYLLTVLKKLVGRDSSVGIATGRSRDRILVEARFSAPVQTGPWAHSASHTMGTGHFPSVKLPGRGGDHPPPPSYTSTSLWAFVACSTVHFTFTSMKHVFRFRH